MIRIKEAIIVEGKYDLNKVKQIFDTQVIATNGFSIFSDRERLDFLRKVAETRGLLILTDSDGAGFVIRNYLKSSIDAKLLKHAYIPEIYGKEKRKAHSSKEGKLGVEGIPDDVIMDAVRKAGVVETEKTEKKEKDVTKAELYEMGLSGGTGSAQKRKKLLKALGLPAYLSANALLEVINTMVGRSELQKILKSL